MPHSTALSPSFRRIMLKQFSWIKCAFSARRWRRRREIHVGVSAIRGRGKRYQFQLILFNHLVLCSPQQHPFRLHHRLCASSKWLNAYKKTSVSFPSLSVSSSLTPVCKEFWMRCNFWLWAKNTCSYFGDRLLQDFVRLWLIFLTLT